MGRDSKVNYMEPIIQELRDLEQREGFAIYK